MLEGNFISHNFVNETAPWSPTKQSRGEEVAKVQEQQEENFVAFVLASSSVIISLKIITRSRSLTFSPHDWLRCVS
jgi:hypothetical protein